MSIAASEQGSSSKSLLSLLIASGPCRTWIFLTDPSTLIVLRYFLASSPTRNAKTAKVGGEWLT
jgi:hypothetical protein